MGSLLATIFSGLLLKRFFEGQFRFDLWADHVAVALAASVAIGAWLAGRGFRILDPANPSKLSGTSNLRQKPESAPTGSRRSGWRIVR